MKKSLLLASAMLASVSAFAATDGTTYETKDGVICYNRWVNDLANTGTFNEENVPFLTNSDRVRTAAIVPDENLVIFGYSKPMTFINGTDTTTVNTAHLAMMSLIDGTGYKEIMLTLDGEPIKNLLCANQVGVDNFGHIWFCGYVQTLSTTPVKLYMVNDLETGACTQMAELLLPAEEAATADGRMDYANLIGDITCENAPCTVMWSLADPGVSNVHRWVRDQGMTALEDWYGGFDGFVSLENPLETYPADKTWGTAPTLTMVLDDEFSGSQFYVDGFHTYPALYDTSGTKYEDFAFDSEAVAFTPRTGCNGVAEFTLGEAQTPFLIYALSQPNDTDVIGAQFRVVKLGDGFAFDGMTQMWDLPAKAHGVVGDGIRQHNLVTKKFIDENGKEGVYILSYKCKNGVGVYVVAEEGFVDPYAVDGVEGIVADENVNAPAEYYNIQGVKVEKPENGFFIKVQGSKATKVVL